MKREMVWALDDHERDIEIGAHALKERLLRVATILPPGLHVVTCPDNTFALQRAWIHTTALPSFPDEVMETPMAEFVASGTYEACLAAKRLMEMP